MVVFGYINYTPCYNTNLWVSVSDINIFQVETYNKLKSTLEPTLVSSDL